MRRSLAVYLGLFALGIVAMSLFGFLSGLFFWWIADLTEAIDDQALAAAHNFGIVAAAVAYGLTFAAALRLLAHWKLMPEVPVKMLSAFVLSLLTIGLISLDQWLGGITPAANTLPYGVAVSVLFGLVYAGSAAMLNWLAPKLQP